MRQVGWLLDFFVIILVMFVFIFNLYNFPVLQMAQVSSSVYFCYVYLALLTNGVIVGPVS